MSEKEVWSSTWYFTFDLRTSGTTTSASLAATEILDSDLRKKLFPTAQTVSFSIDSTVSISGNNVVGSSVPSCELIIKAIMTIIASMFNNFNQILLFVGLLPADQ